MSPLRMLQLFAAAGLVSSILPLTAAAAPGDLDPAFHGTGSYNFTLHGPAGATVQSTGWGSDGKLVIAADIDSAGPTVGFIYRFQPDGSPDLTFNGTGFITLSLPFGSDSNIKHIVALPDGKILLTGGTHIGGQQALILARYLTDGTPDSTFGNGQGWITHPNSGGASFARPALQSTGRILLRECPARLSAFTPMA